MAEGTKPGFWHELSRRAREEGLTEAVIEVKQIAADLENYVELMRKSGLTHAFGLVRATVAAVLRRGGCEPGEMVASLRVLAYEIEGKRLPRRRP
jgi:hypothetical protein